ncbi:MAG: hypothetical protein H0U04_19100 [Rubrobacter sp.]|nr:hypothetical protein [Rubrobacter sp.]
MNTEGAFAELRNQELTDGEVRAVLSRYSRTHRRPPLMLALAVLAAALVAVAVPTSRAELADALRAAFNGGDLPGDVLPADEIPDWLRQATADGGSDPRVIAEVDGQKMLVFRQRSGALCFDFGGIGMCDMTEQSLFGEQPMALFGPIKGGTTGRFQLWGLTLATVASVELRFADAPPIRVPADGAFGIALEPDASPTTLIAHDRTGKIIGQLPVADRWARRPSL